MQVREPAREQELARAAAQESAPEPGPERVQALEQEPVPAQEPALVPERALVQEQEPARAKELEFDFLIAKNLCSKIFAT